MDSSKKQQVDKKSADKKTQAKKQQTDSEKKIKKRRRFIALGVIILILSVVGGIIYYMSDGETTDKKQLSSSLISTTKIPLYEKSANGTTTKPPITSTGIPLFPRTMQITTTTIPPKSQMTPVGSVAISTSKYIVGFSSLYLPGNTNPNTSRLIITGYPFNQLSGNWTIEFYLFIPSVFQGTGNSECVPFSIGNNYNSYIYVSCMNNNFNWMIGTPSTEPFYYNIIFNQTTPFRLNDWNHIAFSYDGSAYLIYCNGVLRYKRISTVNNGTSLKTMYLGTFFNGEYNFSGGGCFIDGLRISKSLRYTTVEGSSYALPFTSRTIPPGVTSRPPPSNYVIDSSTVYMNTFEGLDNSKNFQLNEYIIQ